jgi:hypothetical protein
MPVLVMIVALIGIGLVLAGAVNAALVTWLPSSARGPHIVWTTTLLLVATTIAAWRVLRSRRRR